MFILRKYLNRIKRFLEASENFKVTINSELFDDFEDEDIVNYAVSKHLKMLIKMKRRLKHMLDMAEKYSVSPEQCCDAIFLDKDEFNSSFSRDSVDSSSPSSSSFDSSDSLSSTDVTRLQTQRLKPLKCVTEQLLVLSKSYTAIK